MAATSLDQRIEAVRHFNRVYTRQIGVLEEHLLRSPFSLAEARVVYELAHRRETTATELGAELGLDAGYLSRILSEFHRQRLIRKKPSPSDARQSRLALTERGKAAFAKINAASHAETGAMLRQLREDAQARLVGAMQAIERTLGGAPEPKVSYILRPPEPGDMGWVVHRHGALYWQEYRWDEQFEALVAEIVAKFVQHFDSKRERCWIAERDGENVGSVFLVKKSQTVAKLRLLLVEPQARGLGLGTRLVNECIRFARQVGYRKMTLWTNSVLIAARHIYKKAGFHIVHREKHHSFGHDLVSETWELDL